MDSVTLASRFGLDHEELRPQLDEIRERCKAVKKMLIEEPGTKDAQRLLTSIENHARSLQQQLDKLTAVSMEFHLGLPVVYALPILKKGLGVLVDAFDSAGEYKSHRPKAGAEGVTYDALIILLREIFTGDPARQSEFITDAAEYLGFERDRIKRRLPKI